MCGILFICAGVKKSECTANFDINSLRSELSNPLDIPIPFFPLAPSMKSLCVSDLNKVTKEIAKRGPDSLTFFSSNSNELKIGNDPNFLLNALDDKNQKMIGFSSVLSLRRTNHKITRQPISDNHNNLFLMNGELWQPMKSRFNFIKSEKIVNFLENFEDSNSDSEQLANLLFLSSKLASEQNLSDEDTALLFVNVLQCFEGDFAVVYFDSRTDQTIVAKDFFGKKSLLISFIDDSLMIHSCSIFASKSDDDYKSIEVPRNTVLSISHKDSKIRRYILDSISEPIIFSLPRNPNLILEESVNELSTLIEESIRLMINDRIIEGESISILFSGGLDSTVIAFFILKAVDDKQRVELINVFSNDKAHDKLASENSFKDLKILFPSRNLFFVSKTARLEETELLKEEVMNLIAPLQTEMDLNISSLLKKAVEKHPDSTSKVVFSGLGADELFCGYSRYKNSFNSGGFDKIDQEMKLDQKRLWLRNLGRDDRIISSESCELRTPFITRNLFEFANKLPFSHLLNLVSGENKIVLRRLAFKLGLNFASLAPKRAMQFGTGLAKESNIKNYGSNRAAKGTAIVRLD